jgi:hypothetical protein
VLELRHVLRAQNAIMDELSTMVCMQIPIPAGVLEAYVPHPTIRSATPDVEESPAGSVEPATPVAPPIGAHHWP